MNISCKSDLLLGRAANLTGVAVQAKVYEAMLDAALELRCLLNDKLYGPHYSGDWRKVRCLELLLLCWKLHCVSLPSLWPLCHRQQPSSSGGPVFDAS